MSTIFTVKYGTHNKTKIENISIKLATTITKHTQKAIMTPKTTATATTAVTLMATTQSLK